MKEIPNISLVIPIYNEEENVRLLYDEIRQHLDPLNTSYEIIFVDDGSSDQSFERLKHIKQKEREDETTHIVTRIIRFTRNFGQTAALQAGFDHAKGDIIISLDGDLQNDPRDIADLLAKLNEGYDVVCGWRKVRKDRFLVRTLPSKAANWVFRKITGVSVHDSGCTLKAYRSEVIKSLRFYSDMHRFIPAFTTLKEAKITELVVHHRPRIHGRAKYGLSRIWKVLFDIVTLKMLIHFNEKPLLWFGGSAFIFGFIAISMGGLSVILFVLGERSIVYSGVSFLAFYLFGSLLFWGLLAEFFVKIERDSR